MSDDIKIKEEPVVVKEKNTDEAVEAGLAKLTPERIKNTINQVLQKETGPRFKAYVETCMHCGLCAEACLYFLSNDRDPSYSPAGKVKQTIWGILEAPQELYSVRKRDI